MEPEGSLPHSQAPAICPYPEPDQSTPCLTIPRIADALQYYPPIYDKFNTASSPVSPYVKSPRD
jgi:hypothetical protein